MTHLDYNHEWEVEFPKDHSIVGMYGRMANHIVGEKQTMYNGIISFGFLAYKNNDNWGNEQ